MRGFGRPARKSIRESPVDTFSNVSVLRLWILLATVRVHMLIQLVASAFEDGTCFVDASLGCLHLVTR